MTCITATESKHRPSAKLSAKLAAGLAISAILALGTFAGSASAADRGRGHRGYNHYYSGGYYRSPPVVYGSRYRSNYYGSPYYYYGRSPYYYPPPLVYGPGIGISLPFINLQIR